MKKKSHSLESLRYQDKGLSLLIVSDWSVLAYKSQQPKTSGFPLGTILSVSDGPLGNGKGTPYMYVTEFEDAIKDTQVSLSYTVQPHLNITV